MTWQLTIKIVCCKLPHCYCCQHLPVARSVDGQVLAQVGESNRKDVRNAVDLAAKAQAGWAKRSPFNRLQILYYIAGRLNRIIT